MNKQTFILRDETIRANLMAAVAKLRLDKLLLVTIEPYRKKRTLSQNAYLHLLLGIIADETGNSIDDVKEAYRDMFLGKVPVTLGAEERMVGRSTTTLETVEMNELIEKIRAHAAAELGISLPIPEEAHLRAA
jgi:hypothetical protein